MKLLKRRKPDSACRVSFHFVACLGKDATGEWQSSTADEMFMNNLELQKVDQEAVKDKTEDSPSANMVMQHILRITSDKKLSHLPHLHNAKPIQASHNFVTPNGDVVDAESICEQVKMELVKYSVSQEVFAKAVLGKSQGYLSEMLKHGESFFRPQDHTNYKGWMNFDTMRQFLLKPEAERLRIYYQKGEELKMERLKRRQIEMVSQSSSRLCIFHVFFVVVILEMISSLVSVSKWQLVDALMSGQAVGIPLHA